MNQALLECVFLYSHTSTHANIESCEDLALYHRVRVLWSPLCARVHICMSILNQDSPREFLKSTVREKYCQCLSLLVQIGACVCRFSPFQRGFPGGAGLTVNCLWGSRFQVLGLLLALCPAARDVSWFDLERELP